MRWMRSLGHFGTVTGSLLVLFAIGAACGAIAGDLTLGLIASLLFWLVVILPGLALGRQRDGRQSLRSFFMMFRGGRG